MRRTIAMFTEILVIRWVGDADHGIPRAPGVVRARALEVDAEGVRFNYRLVGDLDMAGHNGWRAFANEGITWAAGWDDETATALGVAYALADHPRPVRDSLLIQRLAVAAS